MEQLTLKGPALAVIQDASGYVSTSTRLSGDNYSNLVINNRDILWVEDGNSNARFLIDVTWSVEKSASNSTLASILRSAHTQVSESQKNPISAGDYTVTVEYTGTHTPASIKKYVKSGNELILTGTDIVPTGYTRAGANDITVINTKTGIAAGNGNGCYVVEDDTVNNRYAIRNITADLTVRIPVTVNSWNAKLDVAWSGSNAQAKIIGYCNGTIDLNVMGRGDNLDTTGKNYHYGDTITVGFFKDYDGYSVYDLKVVSATDPDKEYTVSGTERTGVFSFVMPNEAVILKPTYEAAKFDVNFVGADGVTLTAADGTSKVAKATPNQPYAFNAVAKAGYVLKSITYTGNGLSGNLSNQNNPYTISADAVVNGLTVTFNTELKKFDVTLRTSGVAPTVVELGNNVSRDYKDQTIQSIISFTVNAKSDVVKVTTTTGATIRYTETGYNTTLVTVTGMTGAGYIDVTTK